MAEAKIYVPATDATAPAAPTTRFTSRGSTRRAAGGSASMCAGAFPAKPTGHVRTGQPLLDDDRSAPRRVAVLGDAGVGRSDDVPAGHRRRARAVLPGLDAVPAARRRRSPATSCRCSSGSIRPATGFRSTNVSSSDADTLLVFGLDHLLTEQEASPDEIDAVRRWLAREGTVLVLGPHHDVGISTDLNERAMEYAHHGDALVPRQQRFGKYTRSLMKGLGVPVENRYGLRPGVVKGTTKIAPLTINRDLDTRGWLERRHQLQLPQAPAPLRGHRRTRESVHVLGRQPIDLSRPHPFTEAGNTEFNSFVWMPPAGPRGGEVLLADSTIFSTLFGADESLKRFWKNLATAKWKAPLADVPADGSPSPRSCSSRTPTHRTGASIRSA